jgi:hypothetical protein
MDDSTKLTISGHVGCELETKAQYMAQTLRLLESDEKGSFEGDEESRWKATQKASSDCPKQACSKAIKRAESKATTVDQD